MKRAINKVFEAMTFLVEYIKWLRRFIKKPKTTRIRNSGRVVVCGNGPSTKLFPFGKFRNYCFDFCVVNFFPLDEELFQTLKPKYYISVDPYFHSTLEELTKEELKLVNALNNVTWPMKYVCFKNHHLPLNNDNISYDYINSNVISLDYSKKIKKLLDRNEAIFGYQNVIVAAIYYFIMSQVDLIVLTGVENDWHRELVVDRNNEVFREMTHFYGNEKISVTKNGEIKKGELYNYFRFYYLTLYQYSLLSKYSSDTNTHIINSCIESYIDVFAKYSPSEIIATIHEKVGQ